LPKYCAISFQELKTAGVVMELSYDPSVTFGDAR
jgi:hypothetical protein